MSLGVGSSTSRPWRGPGLLLLGLLLLPAVVAHTKDPEEGEEELQCMCVKTTSGVHPKHIMSLEVIRAGPHCPTSQLLATLKNGRKICLDPQTPRYKKTMKKFMESKLLTA
ncbi:platelet factor 4-like [Pteropus alecto]|uniref:Multifunctional fusion protein n=1 Tax=Pteropus vampyrus TaxID=132908 RepID=A0A6P6CGS2_PTEVA|nr:platelet factor 4-like [Pteropus alecto]XP_023386671.1 platelet factor 4-like isoform X2 [Pteropus vampyrus]XP_039700899.1 platelet factor 4-like isoform X2 [Pteropus giganteus]